MDTVLWLYAIYGVRHSFRYPNNFHVIHWSWGIAGVHLLLNMCPLLMMSLSEPRFDVRHYMKQVHWCFHVVRSHSIIDAQFTASRRQLSGDLKAYRGPPLEISAFLMIRSQSVCPLTHLAMSLPIWVKLEQRMEIPHSLLLSSWSTKQLNGVARIHVHTALKILLT